MPPKPMTSKPKAAGRFGKQDLRLRGRVDAYVVPSAKGLAYSFTTKDSLLGPASRPYGTPVNSRAIKGSWTTARNA